MKQCILTVGISASGKTTWAEEFVQAMMTMENELWINLNRDEIRHHVFKMKTNRDHFQWSQWSRSWEKFVTNLWHDKIEEVCHDPQVKGVICSDTNLNPKTRKFLTDRFEIAGFNVRLKFFEIDYETAVKRDLCRTSPVGSSVIAQQIEQYWDQFGERYAADPTLPKAVIFDVDGTLAHNRGVRSVYDWSNVHLDHPDELVVNIARGLYTHYRIVVVSGRDDVCLEATSDWLYKHLGFKPDSIFMRKTSDGRRDAIVKREIFFRDIAPKYHVVGVLDDRPQVVRMWHSLGLKVLACGLQHIEF